VPGIWEIVESPQRVLCFSGEYPLIHDAAMSSLESLQESEFKVALSRRIYK
jgi:hypothetical protein